MDNTPEQDIYAILNGWQGCCADSLDNLIPIVEKLHDAGMPTAQVISSAVVSAIMTLGYDLMVSVTAIQALVVESFLCTQERHDEERHYAEMLLQVVDTMQAWRKDRDNLPMPPNFNWN